MRRHLFVFLALALYAIADNLPKASPVEAGFSPARLENIKRTLAENAAKNMTPGSVLLVMRHGKVAYFDAAGVLDPATKAPMTKDAIFRVYSMSKAVTSVAAMMLVEEGKLALSDPVTKYIPAFSKVRVGVDKPDPATGKTMLDMVSPRRAITIQDLLRHTSGLTYGIFGFSSVKRA